MCNTISGKTEYGGAYVNPDFQARGAQNLRVNNMNLLLLLSIQALPYTGD